MSFANLLQRFVATDSMQAVARMLPSQVGEILETLATVNPATSRVSHGPLTPGEVLSGAEIFVGSVGVGSRLEGVNFFQGALDGGVVRGCNLASATLNDGEALAVNVWHGPVRGGVVKAANIIIGDVSGGSIEGSNVLVGDVHDGRVSVHTHVGRIFGGECQSVQHAVSLEKLEQ